MANICGKKYFFDQQTLMQFINPPLPNILESGIPWYRLETSGSVNDR